VTGSCSGFSISVKLPGLTLLATCAEIRDAGKEITKLLSSSNRTLKVSKGSQSWKAYVDYVSEIVIEGFVNAIIATIKYLRQQIDPDLIAKVEATPLLEVQLELVAPDIVWKPDLEDGGNSSGVRDMFKCWVMSFLEIGTLVKRLDIGEGARLDTVLALLMLRCS
jgi:dynein heavy chain, axonemal